MQVIRRQVARRAGGKGTMDKHKIMNLIDADFYQIIMDKYQKGKRNSFRFPMMIFLKNVRYLVTQKINIDIFSQLHFYNQKKVAVSIAQAIQGAKRLFSWFRVEKIIPQFIVKPALPKSDQKNKVFPWNHSETLKSHLLKVNVTENKISISSFLQTVFSRVESMALVSKEVLQRLYSTTEARLLPGINPSVNRLPAVSFFVTTHHPYPHPPSPFIPHRKGGSGWKYGGNKHFPLLAGGTRGWGKLLPFMQTVFSRIENTTRASKKVMQQSVIKISAPMGNINYFMNNYLQLVKPHTHEKRGSPVQGLVEHYTTLQKENIRDYQSLIGTMFPGTLAKDNVLLNNRILPYQGKEGYNKMYQNLATVIKPVRRYDWYKSGFDTASLISLQKRGIPKNNDALFFQKNHKIQQEIEEIKKYVAESKEVAKETSNANRLASDEIEKAIKHRLDINLISDQVYHTIERRIRVERERRGL